jgi:hypothetical protein
MSLHLLAMAKRHIWTIYLILPPQKQHIMIRQAISGKSKSVNLQALDEWRVGMLLEELHGNESQDVYDTH